MYLIHHIICLHDAVVNNFARGRIIDTVTYRKSSENAFFFRNSQSKRFQSYNQISNFVECETSTKKTISDVFLYVTGSTVQGRNNLAVSGFRNVTWRILQKKNNILPIFYQRELMIKFLKKGIE